MNDKDKLSAPLWEALGRYAERADASFHVPGHKNGRMYPKDAGGYLAGAMQIDATEITGLDDLHHPEGVIKEAQELAAHFFGAEETRFLVGGSTVGNLALILTVCEAPGDIILVQRNVHKSVIHGLMLARARAVFLAPEMDGASGLATIPREESVREALRRYPGAKAVLITHPNYYGMGGSLAQLAELCHAAGVPLLVDEAHGAHYGLAAELPQSALAQGADGVVQSTHKMLGALTMGAMLHVQGTLINRPLLRQRLAMVQSSSPSYLIMASLDLCRGWLEREGPNAFAESLQAAVGFRAALKQLKRIKLLQPPLSGAEVERHAVSKAASNSANDHAGYSNIEGGSAGKAAAQAGFYTSQDPFKAVLYDAEGEWSGYRLQEVLEELGCVPEMSDERYTVLAFGPGTIQEDVAHLLGALHTLEARMVFKAAEPGEVSETVTCKELSPRKKASEIEANEEKGSKAVSLINASVELSTWNISNAETISEPVPFDLAPSNLREVESVALQHCSGRVAAEMVIPYPPGIPLLYPGETIAPDVLKRLILLRDAGARFQGVHDSTLAVLQVFNNSDIPEGLR